MVWIVLVGFALGFFERIIRNRDRAITGEVVADALKRGAINAAIAFALLVLLPACCTYLLLYSGSV